jgi:hypothetical protein
MCRFRRSPVSDRSGILNRCAMTIYELGIKPEFEASARGLTVSRSCDGELEVRDALVIDLGGDDTAHTFE